MPRKSIHRSYLFLLLFSAVLFCDEVYADVRLHGLFTDNMVIQQSMNVPVWGWAEPGEKITVSLDGQGVRLVGKKENIQAHIEDVNRDGLDDLVLQIEDQDGIYEEGDAVATLEGQTFDGYPIKGSDSICIVPQN